MKFWGKTLAGEGIKSMKSRTQKGGTPNVYMCVQAIRCGGGGQKAVIRCIRTKWMVPSYCMCFSCCYLVVLDSFGTYSTISQDKDAAFEMQLNLMCAVDKTDVQLSSALNYFDETYPGKNKIKKICFNSYYRKQIFRSSSGKTYKIYCLCIAFPRPPAEWTEISILCYHTSTMIQAYKQTHT